MKRVIWLPNNLFRWYAILGVLLLRLCCSLCKLPASSSVLLSTESCRPGMLTSQRYSSRNCVCERGLIDPIHSIQSKNNISHTILSPIRVTVFFSAEDDELTAFLCFVFFVFSILFFTEVTMKSPKNWWLWVTFKAGQTRFATNLPGISLY